MARVSSPNLVGRAQELDQLRGAVARASTGTTMLVLVGGEAGIGKSRLVSAVADEVTAANGLVLSGGCLPLMESSVPFAPFTQALRSLSRTFSSTELEALVGPVVAELTASRPPPGTEDEGTPGSGESRLFEGLLGALVRLSTDRSPVMLVIEDVHWADRSSLDLLVFIARNLRDAAVVIVVTFRSDVLPAGQPVRTLLAELERLPATDRLELRPLGEEEVRVQLKELTGRAPDDATVRVVWQRSDGNPFLVEELASEEVGSEHLPETLRDLLLARVASSPEETQELLRTAAVAGRRFDQGLLERLAPFEPPLVAIALRAAIRASILVTVTDGSWDGLAFRQSLMREAIDDDLLPGDRRRRHAAIAEVLADDPALALSSPAGAAAEIAFHWLAAGNEGQALPLLVEAGAGAERVYAFANAATAYREALHIWPTAERASEERGEHPVISFQPQPGGASPVVAHAGLLRSAARATYLAGDPAEATALLREAMREGSHPAGSVEAAEDLEHLGQYLVDDGRTDEALVAFQQAAAHVDDARTSRIAARVLASQARAVGQAGRHKEAAVIARRAIHHAVSTGSGLEESRARSALGIAMVALGDFDGGLAELTTAHARASDRSRPSIVRPAPSRVVDMVHGYADLAAILERSGRSADAAEVTRQGADAARGLGVHVTWGSILEAHTAVGLFHTGRWDEAERLSRRLLQNGLRGVAAGTVFALRARLEAARGSAADAELHLAAARARSEGRRDEGLAAEIAAGTAELALWQGRLTDARLAVQEGLRLFIGAADRLPSVQLCWIGLRGEADRAERSRVRRASAELAESAEVVAQLRAETVGVMQRLASKPAMAPRELRGFPALADAEASRHLGVADPEPWAAAASVWDSLGDPYLAAYSRWREAEASLLTKGARPRGEARLREAHRVTMELGAEPLRRELEAAAQRARIDLTIDSDPTRAPSATPEQLDHLGLSPREIEVLSLVAQGMTNRQIATELFITEKTASHHVSNLLGKMGAATRIEAAAMAHRLGILGQAPAGE